MSLARGVLLPGFSGTSLPGWIADALRHGLAGVCLFAENTPDIATTRAIADAVHALRADAVVASDEEGGDVTRLQARTGSAIPGNAALGVADDVTLTRAVAEAYGRLIRLAGIDLALGPCLDVASEPLNPVIGVRSFSSSVDGVIRHGQAFVEGLRAAGVASCAKHFPGHGDTRVDSHLALPVLAVDDATLASRELAPFAAVATDAVMTAHVVVPSRGPDPASLSAWAYAEIAGLRGRVPVLTDALGMKAISADLGMGEACVRALEAGADLLILDAPHQRDAETDFADAVAAVEAAVVSGRLNADRLAASAAINATLARPGAPAATPDAVGCAQAELEAVGARAAAAALQTRGDVQITSAPVLLDLRRRLNHASGRTGGALLEAVRFFDRQARAVDGVDEVPAGSALVVLTREPLADPAEGEALAAALAARPDAVVVHGGVAAAAPEAERLVLTHGVGRANANAAAEAMWSR